MSHANFLNKFIISVFIILAGIVLGFNSAYADVSCGGGAYNQTGGGTSNYPCSAWSESGMHGISVIAIGDADAVQDSSAGFWACGMDANGGFPNCAGNVWNGPDSGTSNTSASAPSGSNWKLLDTNTFIYSGSSALTSSVGGTFTMITVPDSNGGTGGQSWLRFVVSDACTGVGLGGADISLDDGNSGTTDGSGYYNFTVNEGTRSWTVTYPGFNQDVGSAYVTAYEDPIEYISMTRNCSQPTPPAQPPGPPQPPPPPPAETYNTDGWVYYDTNGNGAPDEALGGPGTGLAGAQILWKDANTGDIIEQTTTLNTPPLVGYFAMTVPVGSFNLVLNGIPAGYTVTSGGTTVGASNSYPITVPSGGCTYPCISHSFGLSSMSGALNPAAASCSIAQGASTCNVDFTWSTTNPVGTSSVTSNKNNSGASSANFLVGSGNSGGPTAFIITYPSRAFYLYNNSTVLDQESITASCASGNSWNGTSCVATPVTGVCSPTHYLCASGTSINNVNGSSSWTWTCAGANGGSNSPQCSENKGTCPNGAIDPPICSDTTNPLDQCYNGATNPPTCTVNSSNTCINGAINPPQCTINSGSTCINGAVNPPLCTLNSGGTCLNGAVNPPLCTVNASGQCINGAINPPACDQFRRKPVYIEQ